MATRAETSVRRAIIAQGAGCGSQVVVAEPIVHGFRCFMRIEVGF